MGNRNKEPGKSKKKYRNIAWHCTTGVRQAKIQNVQFSENIYIFKYI